MLRTLSVALTRIADQPTLVLDSAERLKRAVERHDAGKISALDIYRAMTLGFWVVSGFSKFEI